MAKVDRRTFIQLGGSAVVAAIVSGIILPVIQALMSPERPIRDLIEQEAKLVLEGKIDEVISLFDEDAFVRDAAGGNKDRETIWSGKDAIIERYRNLPKFVYLKHEAIEITISSDRTYARAIADTIGVYRINDTDVEITSNRGERWTFKKINGRWKITGFTYNLP